MAIQEIPTPTFPEWVKLYNTYDPEHYMPGKRVSAEEWNTLFLAGVRQGNYNADTLELLIYNYLPETYLTIKDYDVFASTLREDHAAFTKRVENTLTETVETTAAFTERVIQAEKVAYALDDVIQEANTFAQQALEIADAANSISQDAYSTAAAALGVSENALATAESSDATSSTALDIAQVATDTANNATSYSAQAVDIATAANIKSGDAIATANAAKVESASAKAESASAKEIATTANTTSDEAKSVASTAEEVARDALSRVTEGLGSKVYSNGVLLSTFDADVKADVTYVNQKIDEIMGPGSTEAIDTILELAAAFKNNSDIIKTLNEAIGNKADKTAIPESIDGLAGGTLTSPLTITGGDQATSSKLILDEMNKGQITGTSTQTLFGFNVSSRLDVGHANFSLNFRGKEARPKYNNKDMALYEDVTALANSIPDTSGFLTSAAMLTKNYIVKGNNYLNVNISGVQIDDNNNVVVPATSGFRISDRVSINYNSTRQALYINVL